MINDAYESKADCKLGSVNMKRPYSTVIKYEFTRRSEKVCEGFLHHLRAAQFSEH